jgi:hypothetical protein
MSWLITIACDLSLTFFTVTIGSACIFSAVLTGISNIYNQPSVLKVSKVNKDPSGSSQRYDYW